MTKMDRTRGGSGEVGKIRGVGRAVGRRRQGSRAAERTWKAADGGGGNEAGRRGGANHG